MHAAKDDQDDKGNRAWDLCLELMAHGLLAKPTHGEENHEVLCFFVPWLLVRRELLSASLKRPYSLHKRLCYKPLHAALRDSCTTPMCVCFKATVFHEDSHICYSAFHSLMPEGRYGVCVSMFQGEAAHGERVIEAAIRSGYLVFGAYIWCARVGCGALGTSLEVTMSSVLSWLDGA